MARPRKPFGANQPGRLPSTMMKVLAAEMSDPQRSRKGKRYAADGSVLDIEIEAGLVTAEIQGSRATPYVATLEVTPGDGMPLRRDLHATCTCPDDDGWNDRACKHVVALMHAFADELLIEPELLDVWRDNDRTESARGDDDATESDDASDSEPAPPGSAADRARARWSMTERADDDDADRSPRRDDAEPLRPHVDELADVLAVPAGRTIPVVPVLDPVDPPLPRRPELAAVLRDALRELRIDWD